jgi:protein-S-isoprenylcysteine O-methyltransferase Ste14
LALRHWTTSASAATVTRVADRPDNPGVKVPPPLFYAAAVVIGYLLDRQWPLPIEPASLVRIAGVVVGVGGVALSVLGVTQFRRAKTSLVPIRPATTFVVSGPYRFTRNPMYVGLALVTIGLALLLTTWWPIVLLPPTLAAVQVFVIQREERYLRRRFGTDYETYTRRVRRWL